MLNITSLGICPIVQPSNLPNLYCQPLTVKEETKTEGIPPKMTIAMWMFHYSLFFAYWRAVHLANTPKNIEEYLFANCFTVDGVTKNAKRKKFPSIHDEQF